MKDIDDLKNRPVPNIKLFGPVDDHYSAYVPGTSGWNHDLMATLLQLAQAGRINLNYLERHVAGEEIYNPTTQVLWTKV